MSIALHDKSRRVKISKKCLTLRKKIASGRATAYRKAEYIQNHMEFEYIQPRQSL